MTLMNLGKEKLFHKQWKRWKKKKWLTTPFAKPLGRERQKVAAASQQRRQQQQQTLTGCWGLTDVSVLCGQICQSKGLVSNDRSEAAAPRSTTPWLRTKSSVGDLAPLHCMGWISLQHTSAGVHASQELYCCGLTTTGALVGSARAYCCLPMPWH